MEVLDAVAEVESVSRRARLVFSALDLDAEAIRALEMAYA